MLIHQAITNTWCTWFKVDKPDESTDARRKLSRVVSTGAYLFQAIKNFKLCNHNGRVQLPLLCAAERTASGLCLLDKGQWESFADEIVQDVHEKLLHRFHEAVVQEIHKENAFSLDQRCT